MRIYALYGHRVDNRVRRLLSNPILSFFFSGHLPLGHLHSFPTRRSSDRPPRPGGDPRRLHGTAAMPPRKRVGRSEEHTFELQSHHDLVCRLLLEKKKITKLVITAIEIFQNQYTISYPPHSLR